MILPDMIIMHPSPVSFPSPLLPTATVMPPRIFLLLFLLFLLFFFKTSSSCVTQIGLELRILLSQLTECWDYVCVTLIPRFYLWNYRTFHLEFCVELATLLPRCLFGCGRRLSPHCHPVLSSPSHRTCQALPLMSYSCHHLSGHDVREGLMNAVNNTIHICSLASGLTNLLMTTLRRLLKL